jgi:hypothetical protein
LKYRIKKERWLRDMEHAAKEKFWGQGDGKGGKRPFSKGPFPLPRISISLNL